MQADVLLADHAYAVTCHKFQGSSARHVGISARGIKGESARWNYTAVTRAEQEVTIFQ
jgi:ATP-dependent exoDNAse (exonuclease V) alpha subunit